MTKKTPVLKLKLSGGNPNGPIAFHTVLLGNTGLPRAMVPPSVRGLGLLSRIAKGRLPEPFSARGLYHVDDCGL